MQFQWWIQDFPEGALPIISKKFAENCMKMKKKMDWKGAREMRTP